MDEKKFQELMENEDFITELLSKEEPEDAQKLFADNGVELSIDEIKWLGGLFANAIDGDVDTEKLLSIAKGEITADDLSDDELKDVSGGVVGTAAAAASAAKALIEATGGTYIAPAAAGAASTGVGIPIAIGIVAAGGIAAGVITVTRSWGKVGRGVSRAARSVGRALTSRW